MEWGRRRRRRINKMLNGVHEEVVFAFPPPTFSSPLVLIATNTKR
jgi:hypothetical protein